MIALVPSAADTARLAVDGGEPVDELHLTLFYLGKAAAIDATTRAALVTAVTDMASRRELLPVDAEAFAVAMFNPAGDEPCWVLGVGDRVGGPGESLGSVRAMVLEALYDGAVQFTMPDQRTPWSPHVTLLCTGDTALAGRFVGHTGPIRFDRIRISFAGQATDIPLGAAVPGLSVSPLVLAVVREEFVRLGLLDYKSQPRDPGGDDGGQWVSGPAAGGSFSGMHAATRVEKESFRERFGKAIPPAWTDVHIADDLDTAKLLVRGKDAKGRGQSIYSQAHTESQAEAKFARVKAFAAHLDTLDAAVERDAMSNDDAAALLLIRRLGMRPGSNRDTGADKEAHGATNLKVEHVTVGEDGAAHFDFIGKKGVHIQLSTKDPLIAAVIRKRLVDRGGEQGVQLFSTTEDKTRAYMRSNGVPAEFLLKDLRTVHANVVALRAIARRGDSTPKTQTQYRQWRKEIGELVSAQLGNTPALALQSYINPTVFTKWRVDASWS